jgi:hypothetical protein
LVVGSHGLWSQKLWSSGQTSRLRSWGHEFRWIVQVTSDRRGSIFEASGDSLAFLF